MPANPDNATNAISLSPRVIEAEVERPGPVGVSFAGTAISTSAESGLLPDAADQLRAPGLTTKPVIDLPQPPPRAATTVPRMRALGNIELSVREIEELFMM